MILHMICFIVTFSRYQDDNVILITLFEIFHYS